jgi:hypothetical protein
VNPLGYNIEHVEKLWRVSEEVLKIEFRPLFKLTYYVYSSQGSSVMNSDFLPWYINWEAGGSKLSLCNARRHNFKRLIAIKNYKAHIIIIITNPNKPREYLRSIEKQTSHWFGVIPAGQAVPHVKL